MNENRIEFQIYGRATYEQPLTFIKAIESDPAEVKAVALAQVGDGSWIEIVAIPTNALLHVVGGE